MDLQEKFTRIREIPILEIADQLGIEHGDGRKNVPCYGGHDSKTNSMRFNLKTNKATCFAKCGMGGDNIDLVASYNKWDFNDNFAEILGWFEDRYPDVIKKPLNKGKYSRTGQSKKNMHNVSAKKAKPYMTVKKATSDDDENIDWNVINQLYRIFYNSLPFQTSDKSYLVAERHIDIDVLRGQNIKRFDVGGIFPLFLDKLAEYERYGAVTKELANLFRKQTTKTNSLFMYIGLILRADLNVEKKDVRKYVDASSLVLLSRTEALIPFYKNEALYYIQGVGTRKAREEGRKYFYMRGRRKPFLWIPTLDIEEGGDVYITEGVLDALSLMTIGLNSVALMDAGITETDKRIVELDALKGRRVILLLDNDNPGEKAKEVLYRYMIKHGFDVARQNIQDIANNIGISGYVKDANKLLGLLVEEEMYENEFEIEKEPSSACIGKVISETITEEEQVTESDFIIKNDFDDDEKECPNCGAEYDLVCGVCGYMEGEII